MNKYLLITIAAAALAGFCAYAQTVWTYTDSRDGKTYKIVKIGNQYWFAENLNYAAEGSKCYENKDANCAKYGRLYDWATANKACPAGYHLPSDKEWAALVDYAGGDEKAGTTLKSTKGWKCYEDVPAGTNPYGFSAMSGGYGSSDGRFYYAGSYGYWWSATESSADNASSRLMYCYYEGVHSGSSRKTYLWSVRCVEDE